MYWLTGGVARGGVQHFRGRGSTERVKHHRVWVRGSVELIQAKNTIIMQDC